MSLLDELLDLATTELLLDKLLLCLSRFRCLKAAATVEARDNGVGFARHGLWAVGGGLCSLVVAGYLGGFGCWFGGCLGVGLIGGSLRQWVFGWWFWVAQNNIGISGSCSYSISRVQRKGPISVRVVALGLNGRAGEGNELFW
nr:hypothetical protein CFP56_20135 [Quercus suber]